VPVAVVASRVEADLIVGLLRNNGLRAVVSADDAGGLEPQLQVAVIRCQERDKVRARLLRMILDNEGTRRNDWRTTAR